MTRQYRVSYIKNKYEYSLVVHLANFRITYSDHNIKTIMAIARLMCAVEQNLLVLCAAYGTANHVADICYRLFALRTKNQLHEQSDGWFEYWCCVGYVFRRRICNIKSESNMVLLLINSNIAYQHCWWTMETRWAIWTYGPLDFLRLLTSFEIITSINRKKFAFQCLRAVSLFTCWHKVKHICMKLLIEGFVLISIQDLCNLDPICLNHTYTNMATQKYAVNIKTKKLVLQCL